MLQRQIDRLVAAYIAMHPEDREFLLDHAEERAAVQINARPHLTLVGRNLAPASSAPLRDASSEANNILSPSFSGLLIKS